MFKNRFVVIAPGMGTSQYDSDQEQEARCDYAMLNNATDGVRLIDRQKQPLTLKRTKKGSSRRRAA